MNRRRSEIFVWAAASAAFAAFLYFLTARAGYGFDACDYYLGAEDWLRGLRPYVDFAFSKTPGILFLTAALFHTVGTKAVVLPWFTTCVNVGWAATAAWAFAPVLGPRSRWVFPGSLAVALCAMVNFWNAEQPMTWCVVAAAGVWLRPRLAERPLGALAIGVLLGAGTLFKLFALLSIPATLLLIAVQAEWAWAKKFKLACAMGAGYAAVLAMTAAWAWRAGVLEAMWEQSFLTPLLYYRAHTHYLSDFLKRIGWFVAPTGAGMLLSVAWFIRRPGHALWKLSVLGLPFLLPLYKNHAAHYVIPYIPFAMAWSIEAGQRAAARLGPGVRKIALFSGAVAVLVVASVLVAYKAGSFKRVFLQDAAASQRAAYGELARWVGEGERAVIINGGPFPHLNLYWGCGERPYPWPFLAVSGFQRKAIEDFGFQRFYDVCADPKTRVLAIRLDVPMEETLEWPYSPGEMQKLSALLASEYQADGVYPGVYVRRGSAPANKTFRRGPYAGEAIGP